MIKYAKAIGGNTDFLTAQSFIFSRDFASYRLFLVLLISGEGEDVFSKVRQAALDLEPLFFDSNENLPERLTSALNSLKQLQGVESLQILVLSVKEKFSGPEVVEDFVYIKNYGSQEVFLQRDGKTEQLVINSDGEQLISGLFKKGDKIVLTNLKPDNKLFETLLKVPPETAREEVDIYFQQATQAPPLAVAVIENAVEQEGGQTAEVVPYEISAFHEGQGNLRPKITLPKTRNKIMVLAIVFLIVLVFALGVYLKKDQYRQGGQFVVYLDQARQNFTAAQSFKDSDPDKSKSFLISAKNSLAQALKIKPKDSAALGLQKNILDNSNSILNIYSINNWPVFLSLDLIKKDFSAKHMSVSMGDLLLLDTGQKTLVVLDLAKKNNRVLAGSSQLGNAMSASINGDNIFVYSSDKGILGVDPQTQKVTTIAKIDPGWGRIVDIYGFAGNAYLLDSIQNQVWKYIAGASGYSDKNQYLTSQKADFSGAKRMQIDSSVWVLKSGPEILRFTTGAVDSFNVSGLDQPIKDISAFFVSDETDNLYIIDPPNSRLVVLTKNGKYQSQYVGDKFKSADDLVVDEKGKKIYLLEGGKIYQLDLR